MSDKKNEPGLIRVYRIISFVLPIGGFILIVWVATNTQGYPDGFILGVFMGGLVALLGWFRLKNAADQATKAHTKLQNSFGRMNRNLNCPRCSSPAPRFQFPSSVRRVMYGGWICKQCGCEVDRDGHEVASS